MFNIFHYKRVGKKSNLQRHKRKVHKQENTNRTREWKCRYCLKVFGEYSALFSHVEANHPLSQTGGRQAFSANSRELSINNHTPTLNESDDASVKDTVDTNDIIEESALRDGVQKRTVYPKGNEKFDMLVFLAKWKSEIRNYLVSKLKRSRSIKWNMCIQVEMERDSAEAMQNTSPYFRSRTYLTLTNETFSEHDLNEALQKMHGSMEKFLREGSGWYVKKIIKLEIHTVVYSPLSGSSYIPLPKTLADNKGSILNIKNMDEKCALWCLLASMHPAEKK